MPSIPKETTERGVCSKITNPPKGVGGSIIQSLELKRHVQQKPNGKVKVYERAIEECQSISGSSTIREGTNVYYFDNNDSSTFEGKLECINQELDEKVDEMEMIDMLLAENELRLAKLDAELAKFSGLDEVVIKEPSITDDKDKEVLRIPTVQNLVFKIYDESGINISSDEDKSSPLPEKGSLNCQLDQFCKNILQKNERDKNKQNLQNTRSQLPSDRINLPIEETKNRQRSRNRSITEAPVRTPKSKLIRNLQKCLEDCNFTADNDGCEQHFINPQFSSCSPPPKNDFRKRKYKMGASNPPLCDNINDRKNDDLKDLPPKLIPKTFSQCLAECAALIDEIAAPQCLAQKPNLFSQMLNGKRFFPDISEISTNDHKQYMAERDAYLLFRQEFPDGRNEKEFEKFYCKYINGSSKIDIPTCPRKKQEEDKTPLENLVYSFVNINKIELEPSMQRNVLDMALDRPDQDPDVIALLMNEPLPIFADPLVMSDLVTPYTLQKRLFGTDIRHTAPGSIVPQKIPVQDLNVMNLHVMDNVEAIIKSHDYLYPEDCHATEEIKDVIITKPEKDEQHKECESEDNYKCLLDLHPFRVENFFQLRGANIPLWYPGMFTAFPDGSSLVKLIKTPSTLIMTAWKLCAP